MNIKKPAPSIEQKLSRYMKPKDNGCTEWTGTSFKNYCGDRIPTYTIDKYQYHVQNLLTGVSSWCQFCENEYCDCENRIFIELTTTCNYASCVNKEHCFTYDFEDFRSDVKSGMTNQELQKKYYKSATQLNNMIEELSLRNEKGWDGSL